MQRTGNSRTFEWLGGTKLFAQGAQPWHLMFGEVNLFSAKRRQR
jgi:hypothetical protein